MTADGTTLTIGCDSDAKMAVLNAVEESGSEVANFETEEASRMRCSPRTRTPEQTRAQAPRYRVASENPVQRVLERRCELKNSEFADWYPISKKEFRDTVRSPWIWVLSFIFIVLFALPAVLGKSFDTGQQSPKPGRR